MQKIFVTIVNYNGEEDTNKCLEFLNNTKIDNFELNVVIIDNASLKQFSTKKEYKFKLTLLNSKSNLGFAGGQNLGITYALGNGADYIAILNNDVILDDDFLINLLNTFSQKTDCGIVSPKIYFAKGYEFHKDRYQKYQEGKVIWYAGGKIDWDNVIASHRGVDEVDEGQYDNIEETDFASGCCMMVKVDVFKKIGLFDEKYFLYYEDNDIGQRAKKAGFKIYYQPTSFIWHLNAGSTGGSGSPLHDYYITRNRLLFGAKFAPLRAKLALLKESWKLLLKGREWQKKAIKDFYLGRFGKGSYNG